MSNLNANDKDLLLEYCLGVPESLQEGRSLVSSRREAAKVCESISEALAPLESIAAECPDELARRTLDRLRAAARSDAAAASSPVIFRLGWPSNLSNFAGVVTVAACIVIILGAAFPSFSLMKYRYYRQVCLNQLNGLYRSIGLYSSDHDGMAPAVTIPVGATWAGIGRQGPDSYSNTRPLFLLPKLDYSTLEQFVCCGPRMGRPASLTPEEVRAYDDFPSRQDVTYSYRLMDGPRTTLVSLASQPLMADMNPHFENLASPVEVCPSEESLCQNSRNHRRKGQSVLWGDGHVRFTSTRTVGQQDDDIYTISNTSTYRGREWPTDPWDTFIAP